MVISNEGLASRLCRLESPRYAVPVPEGMSGVQFSEPQVAYVGARVMLRGLQKGVLNGAIGTVIKADVSRVGVLIDATQSSIAVKYENVFLMAAGPCPVTRGPLRWRNSDSAACAACT